MGKRKRIGLIYLFDKHWLGGLYYAQNLVYALGTLADELKPVIDVYCYNESVFEELSNVTHYPYLNINLIDNFQKKRTLRNILYFFSKKKSYNINLFKILPEDEKIFPYNWGSSSGKLIHWIPDFQDKYFPQYFSKFDLKRREESIIQTCKRGIPIVFSSNECEKDFKKFYPKFASHQTYIVHFAVHQQDYSSIDLESILKRYNICRNYILCANQFWEHKNHLFLFKAFKKAIDYGSNLQLVCTGSLEGSRNPEYAKSLQDFIKTNNLNDNIKLLGIIKKEELLCLMKHSYSVVQPSLFEGWNTTVEDCKCMNKFIFLSDLNVHREQINKNVCFFNPYDEEDLAKKLCTVKPKEEYYDYSDNIRQFGMDFYSVIQQ